jgi:hypothetical protein
MYEARRNARPGCGDRWKLRIVAFAPVAALLLAAAPTTLRATQETGCCSFLAAASAPSRRCANLTRTDCDRLRPLATFFRGQYCDERSQRCVLGALPTAPAVPTATATPTATMTPVPTDTAPVIGCCEVAASRAVPFPICGNRIARDQCFEDFGFRASFCETCRCSSHDEDGFALRPGGCVRPTPTATPPPTRTATPVPTRRFPRPTATATPTAAIGCCEVPVSSGPQSASFCGNAIARDVCLTDFPGARFCPECACSSHSSPGFGTVPGRCVQRPARPRPPRAPLPPRAPRR